MSKEMKRNTDWLLPKVIEDMAEKLKPKSVTFYGNTLIFKSEEGKRSYYLVLGEKYDLFEVVDNKVDGGDILLEDGVYVSDRVKNLLDAYAAAIPDID